MNALQKSSAVTRPWQELAQRGVEKWGLAGSLRHAELRSLISQIKLQLRRGGSPAKGVAFALKKLNQFYSLPDVKGELRIISNRSFSFDLAFPERDGDDLTFCLLTGHINGRSGTVELNVDRPIQLSFHALERIFERLENCSESSVLDEVYSVLSLSPYWRTAGAEVKARCWPLRSPNGFFVTTASQESDKSCLVTWMKYKTSRMGKKWGLPVRSWDIVAERIPERLRDVEFVKGFLRSFPWMLHEHFTREDLADLAWEQREEMDSTHEDDFFASESASDGSKMTPRLSNTYISGVNYGEVPPTFKAHTEHIGYVVQVRSKGHLLIGLLNGWVAYIPARALERGRSLIPDYVPPEIGDKIAVRIHKIKHLDEEQGYAISVDPIDVSEANWKAIEIENPIGKELVATTIKQYMESIVVQTDDGLRGSIPSTEFADYMRRTALFGTSPIGIKVHCYVVGYRSEKRYLLLSFRNSNGEANSDENASALRVGQRVSGTCMYTSDRYSNICLIGGVIGTLYILNCRGIGLPKVGEEIEATVIFINENGVLLAAHPSSECERSFYALPMTPERWIEFTSRHSVGDEVEVQILSWMDDSKFYLAATEHGVVGMLAKKEFDWSGGVEGKKKKSPIIGEFIKVAILNMREKKHQIAFSRRLLLPHPVTDLVDRPEIVNPVRGRIVSAVDYGYFVYLEDYNFQGLLHRTRVPPNSPLSLNQDVWVVIEEVDVEKRRVGLALANNALPDCSGD